MHLLQWRASLATMKPFLLSSVLQPSHGWGLSRSFQCMQDSSDSSHLEKTELQQDSEDVLRAKYPALYHVLGQHLNCYNPKGKYWRHRPQVSTPSSVGLQIFQNMSVTYIPLERKKTGKRKKYISFLNEKKHSHFFTKHPISFFSETDISSNKLHVNFHCLSHHCFQQQNSITISIPIEQA